MWKRGWLVVVSLIVAFWLAVAPASAQAGGALLAFLNSSGQLVVSSGDGGFRWIVTNPGEAVNPQIGYAWSPGGNQLFFALGGMNDLSLRVADAGSQSVSEIGRVGGQISGGNWAADGSAIVLGVDNRVVAVTLGGEVRDLATAQGAVTLRSPFESGNRPNASQPKNLAPGGELFFQSGSAAFVQPSGGQAVTLPGGDPNAQYNGLWAPSAPLVAHSGVNGGNSVLVVTNASTGGTVALDSGRTAPINAVAWRPGTTQLVYRDATNFVRIADLSCLTSGCGDNPLEQGVELMPASASDVQVGGNFAFYVDNGAVMAVDLSCANAGSCAGSAFTLGTNAAPGTMMHVAGSTLAYTAFGQDAYNPTDRTVSAVNLACLSNRGSCAAVPVLQGAVSGLVSPDGAYVVVEQVGGQLSALRFSDGALTYLSDPAGSSLLPYARWNGR